MDSGTGLCELGDWVLAKYEDYKLALNIKYVLHNLTVYINLHLANPRVKILLKRFWDGEDYVAVVHEEGHEQTGLLQIGP